MTCTVAYKANTISMQSGSVDEQDHCNSISEIAPYALHIRPRVADVSYAFSFAGMLHVESHAHDSPSNTDKSRMLSYIYRLVPGTLGASVL